MMESAQPHNEEWVVTKLIKSDARYQQSHGVSSTGDYFSLRQCLIPTLDSLGDGEVAIETTQFSVDASLENTLEPEFSALGRTVEGCALGWVVHSKRDGFYPGDLVMGDSVKWRLFSVIDRLSALKKIDRHAPFPHSYYLGALGLPGLSAILAVKNIAPPKTGQIVFITDAAGDVGSIVGQLYKLGGAIVIGGTNSEAKVNTLLSIGFDAAFECNERDIRSKLSIMFPHGIDVFFDYAGGAFFEHMKLHLYLAALLKMNANGTVVVSGGVSSNALGGRNQYPHNMFDIVSRRLNIRGYSVIDFAEQFNEAFVELKQLVSSGKLRVIETVLNGFGQLPSALADVLQGRGVGKTCVRLNGGDERFGSLPGGKGQQETQQSRSFDAKTPWPLQKEWQVASFPDPLIAAENFRIVEVPMPDPTSLRDGEIMMKMAQFSVDPYMRKRLDPKTKVNFVPPFEVGKPMEGFALGFVEYSRRPDFEPGDMVIGSFLPWREFNIIPADKKISKVERHARIPDSYHLGILGVTGLSALLSIKNICPPKPGKNVFVTDAAGAVGSVAAQLYKLGGCRVIGSCGSQSKINYLRSIGLDGAFNYKQVVNLSDELKLHFPNGIDVFYDNVGGPMYDAALEQVNTHGVVIMSGGISQYNTPSVEQYGARNVFDIVAKRLRVEGYLVLDYVDQLEAGTRELLELVLSGKINVAETVWDGFDRLADALVGIFHGRNLGKMCVRISEDHHTATDGSDVRLASVSTLSQLSVLASRSLLGDRLVVPQPFTKALSRQKVWLVAKFPDPMISEECFEIGHIPIPEQSQLVDGEVIMRMAQFSVDPYMRKRLDPKTKVNFVPPFQIGKPMEGFALGFVHASRRPGFDVGDMVVGSFLPWQEYFVVPKSKALTKVEKNLPVPHSYHLGVLGITGLSAYLSIKNISPPRVGDVVFVTDAAGAVGSVAAQIYKLGGCRVVGSAGTNAKVEQLLAIGLDGAFNYKEVLDLGVTLRHFFPDGIDVFYDNVGGAVFDAALELVNTRGVVIMSGGISQYNVSNDRQLGAKNVFDIVAKRLRVEGYLVLDYSDQVAEATRDLTSMVIANQIHVFETRVEGFERVADALVGIFHGRNTGKMVCQIWGDGNLQFSRSLPTLPVGFQPPEIRSRGISKPNGPPFVVSTYLTRSGLRDLKQREWLVEQFPDPLITNECFRISECPLPDPLQLADGELIMRMAQFSVDPYMRKRLDPKTKVNFVPPFEIGKPMEGFALGYVAHSRRQGFTPGDLVVGSFLPWREYNMIPSDKKLTKLDPSLPVPLSYHLGVLGVTGLSALLSIKNIAPPKPGLNVFITDAAGAVGSVAAQIYKLGGCRVVGSAGSNEKVKLLLDMGLDGAFNYKHSVNFSDTIRSFFPLGIDIFYDNVGGTMYDAALEQVKNNGTVVMSGGISQYNTANIDQYTARNVFDIVAKRLRVEGYLVLDYVDQIESATRELTDLVIRGKLRVLETVWGGFDRLSEALVGIYSGRNIGKMCVDVLPAAELYPSNFKALNVADFPHLSLATSSVVKSAFSLGSRESNAQWTLLKSGAISDSGVLELSSCPIPDLTSLADGEVLLRMVQFSVDAHVRQQLDQSTSKTSAVPFIGLGSPMRGYALGRVIASKRVTFLPGDLVAGSELPWRLFNVVEINTALKKIEPVNNLPDSCHLSILGLSGISVALAISKVAPSRRGHNVFISDLCGGLGIFAAQLYKLEGARVVGSVTSLSMLNYARLLGFTDVFIVNRETDIEIGIVRFFPRGIDVFFDCVGGSAYQRALDHMAENGLVVVASQLGAESALLNQHLSEIPAVYDRLRDLLSSGKLLAVETTVNGFDQMRVGIEYALSGNKPGKIVVQIPEPQPAQSHDNVTAPVSFASPPNNSTFGAPETNVGASSGNEEWVLAHFAADFAYDSALAKRSCSMPHVSDLAEGELLVQVTHLSLDSHIPLRMKAELHVDFIEQFRLDQTIEGYGLGQVVHSRRAGVSVGDIVRVTLLEWRRYTVVAATKKVFVIDKSTSFPLSFQLGVLGVPGISVSLVIEHFARVTVGQTAFITDALGAMGSIASQLLKRRGCNVIGSVSRDEDVAFARSTLGLDNVIVVPIIAPVDFGSKLEAALPTGIDLLFDTIGGALYEESLHFMNDNGVVLAASHLGVEGRLLREHAAEIPETIAVLSSLLRSGELKVVETIRSGFKFLGSTLFEMARGSLRGKVLVEVGSTAFRSVASGINLSYPLSKLEHISGGVGNLPAGNMKEGMHFEGANVRGDRIKSTSYEANKRWVVARLAQKNEPVVSCFHLLDTDMPLPESLREGELILKMALFSVDAYLRERLNSQSRETFVTRLVVGQVMDSFAIGLVTHSRRVGFVAGDMVIGSFLQWQLFNRIPADKRVTKLDPDLSFPRSYYLGILGITGLSAMLSVKNLAPGSPGKSVFVSDAAGGVGAVAGQLYKIAGCRVVGCAGTDSKVNYLLSIGFDAAFNYRSGQDESETLVEMIEDFFPHGIDIFFDCLGGDVHEAALSLMNDASTVVAAAGISQINTPNAKDIPQATKELMRLVSSGRLRVAETITDGFSELPSALDDLLAERSLGSSVVDVDSFNVVVPI